MGRTSNIDRTARRIRDEHHIPLTAAKAIARAVRNPNPDRPELLDPFIERAVALAREQGGKLTLEQAAAAMTILIPDGKGMDYTELQAMSAATWPPAAGYVVSCVMYADASGQSQMRTVVAGSGYVAPDRDDIVFRTTVDGFGEMVSTARIAEAPCGAAEGTERTVVDELDSWDLFGSDDGERIDAYLQHAWDQRTAEAAASAGRHRWITMHDDPEAEGWVGDFNNLTREDYLAIMHSATPGARIVVDPEWLHQESTAGAEPTEVSALEMSESDVSHVFDMTRDEGVLLRVTVIGPADGDRLEVMVDAVHDLADVYAAPGSPVRRLLDFFLIGSESEPDPMNDLWERCPQDGFGDPVWLDDQETAYARQGSLAKELSKELDLPHDWRIDCVFPDEMLYALQVRGAWTEEWTAEGYLRIALRFERAFGIPLHPDDDLASPREGRVAALREALPLRAPAGRSARAGGV